jgi:hypothetical protein
VGEKQACKQLIAGKNKAFVIDHWSMVICHLSFKKMTIDN